MRTATAAVLALVALTACERANAPPRPLAGPPIQPKASALDAGVPAVVGSPVDASAQARTSASSTPPLWQAAQSGELAEVKRLLAIGADVEEPWRPYGTALMAALEFEHEDVARALLEAGTKVGPRSEALILAARGSLVGLFPLLTARGADVKMTDSQGHTALHAAAKSGSVDTVRRVIGLGADVNAVGDDGFTPLHSAAADDRIDAVRALLDARARIDATSRGGTTVLHWAVFANRSHRKEYFSHEGEPPHSGPEIFETDAPLVELLLARGASVDAADGEGNTPLHHAVLMRAPAAARALLRHGAKRSARNKEGKTPLEIATARRERTMIDALK